MGVVGGVRFAGMFGVRGVRGVGGAVGFRNCRSFRELPKFWNCWSCRLRVRSRGVRDSCKSSHFFVPALPSRCVSIHWTLSSMCKSASQQRVLVGCSSLSMRPAEHLTALRAWCNVWSVKTRRAPSQHCRDARVLRPDDLSTRPTPAFPFLSRR